jgi:hypothetical protein
MTISKKRFVGNPAIALFNAEIFGIKHAGESPFLAKMIIEKNIVPLPVFCPFPLTGSAGYPRPSDLDWEDGHNS